MSTSMCTNLCTGVGTACAPHAPPGGGAAGGGVATAAADGGRLLRLTLHGAHHLGTLGVVVRSGAAALPTRAHAQASPAAARPEATAAALPSHRLHGAAARPHDDTAAPSWWCHSSPTRPPGMCGFGPGQLSGLQRRSSVAQCPVGYESCHRQLGAKAAHPAPSHPPGSAAGRSPPPPRSSPRARLSSSRPSGAGARAPRRRWMRRARRARLSTRARRRWRRRA